MNEEMMKQGLWTRSSELSLKNSESCTAQFSSLFFNLSTQQQISTQRHSLGC